MTLLRNTLLVCSIFALSIVARADAIITGSTASGDTFSIDAITSNYAPGILNITGAIGEVTIGGVANTITGVQTPTAPGVVTYSTSGFFIFDNLLYTGSTTPFDYYGGLFTLANGTDLELNLFYNNGDPTSGVYYNNSGFNSPITSINVMYTVNQVDEHAIGANAIGATPEPSSMVLLGSGLMISAFILRKKLVPVVAETSHLA
jgi:PEP-CTERM motif